MASWKEKGIVLDSDDSDDALDSQETLRGESVQHQEPNVPELNNSDSEDELAKDGYRIQFETGAERITNEVTKESRDARRPLLDLGAEVQSAPALNGRGSDGESTRIRDLERDGTRERTQSLGESLQRSRNLPAIKRVFKVLPEFVDVDGSEVSIEGNNSRKIQDSQAPPLDSIETDEISTTYVRLSSPLSSPPLPLPDISPGNRNSHESPGSLNNPPLRSFRPRAPIQMQPFTLEMGQYRKTIWGAGIKTYRIDEEEQRRQAKEAQKDSQDLAFEADEDSQTTNFIATENPSFSSQPQPIPGDSDDPFRPFDSDKEMVQGTGNEESNYFSDMDVDVIGDKPSAFDNDEDSDELPKIGDILRGGGKERAQRSGQRKRPRTYRTNRLVIPETSKSNDLQDQDGRGYDIFSFPPSPPITSPTVLSDPAKRILQRVSSVGSRKSSPLIQSDRPRASDVPTPAVSATGRPGHEIVVSLDSDSEDDDYISLVEPSRTPSPEPEDRIRRVAKRIRGVLPASWLRLDQKPQTPSSPIAREPASPSPGGTFPQRGVAIPRPARDAAPSIPRDTLDPFFLDGESESDQEDAGDIGRHFEIETFKSNQPLAGSLLDDAIEDNRVDRMLPPRKRKSTGLSNRTSKKHRVSNKLFHGSGSGYARQPKIVDQFNRAQSTSKSGSRSNDTAPGKKIQGRKLTKKPLVKKFVAPSLSILDSIEPGSQAFKDAPVFIRIASRTAKSKRHLGRHNPSRKFIRLDNIDDTNDAQSVLRDWREGTVLPNKSLRYSEPLQRQHTLNSQATLPSHPSTVPPRSQFHRRAPRTLIVPKRQQTTLDGVIGTVKNDGSYLTRPSAQLPPIQKKAQLLHHRPHAQPAQLETEEGDYNRSHPNAGFGTTKKGLDRIFRRSHRGAAVKGDIQLARFLADPDAVGSMVDDSSYQADLTPPAPEAVEIEPPRPNRCRKRSPQHLDAGAQKYRQPSEPLPVDNYFITANARVAAPAAGKLLGLQPYGTRYTYHFDIFPLQSGVFFHESTFVGNGQPSRVLGHSHAQRDYWTRTMLCSYQLDKKQFQWAEWGANVSSELGLCFDWISGQLEVGTSPTTSAVELFDFILKYVEQHLFFVGQEDQQNFVRRVCDIVDGLLTRTYAPKNATTSQPMVEILSRLLVLLMQLLRMCQQPNIDFSLRKATENSLQRTSERCASFLIMLGIDRVRDFYEECQYLTSRESGVRRNRYYVEAWVIMMKVMQAAQIPRLLFWDVVNKSLCNENLEEVDDAQVLEKMWYNMFSLLPLMEFDEAGVINTGLRHIVSVENWALPQKLMKRVFVMYALKSRQSAGFNDYVRILFVRCHYLMAQWGWRRCGTLIGILFDFFASHNLAHLHNEESFTSPRFLEELDAEPSLSVEEDDKCFHIFLKIVATSIKHLRQAGDAKGIRNLVTRLLPNHDRQYPKEEAIHQRDLASLRNHHDLLCTLFWAAPVDHRPITLLQQLVIPERSHKEACLINLRAWSNLSKFLLATSPVPDEYQKLVEWQHDVFSKLVHQYQTAEEEIRQQHAALSYALQQHHSEQSICDTIDKNKEQAIEEISCHLRAINLQMENAKDIEAAKTVFVASRPLVTSVFGLFGKNPSAYERAALETALQFLEYYFLKSENFQQSLAKAEYEEREATILGRAGSFSVFDDKLLVALERTVEQMLEKKIKGINEKLVVGVWAKICAFQARREDFFKDKVTILQTKVGKWISGYEYPAGAAEQAQTYAPLFIAVFLQQVPTQVFKRSIAQRSMFQEWLCSIAKPTDRFRFEYLWTMSLIQTYQLPTVLLRETKSYLPRYIISMSSQKNILRTVNESSEESKLGLSILKKDQFIIIEGVVKYIFDAYKDSSNRPDSAQPRRHLAIILQSLMTTLKDHYTAAYENQSTSSINYQQFVRQVISSIKTYANDVCPLDRFFTEAGTIYYHLTADGPNFFVPTMINHGIRMSERGGDSKLFYYCWESIKVMVRRQECDRLPGLLMQVMDHDLKSKEIVMGATEAIVTILTPAALWAGWQTNEGFIIADVFLRVVEKQVLVVAGVDMKMAAEMTIPVIRHITNGLWTLYASSAALIPLPHLYLVTRVVRFMIALWDLLAMTSSSIPDLPPVLQQFADFAKAATTYYEEKELVARHARFHGNSPIKQRIPEPQFGTVICDEYINNWEYRNGRVWVRTGSRARSINVSSYTAAGEVLVRGVDGDEGLVEEKELVGEVVDALRMYNELLDYVNGKRKRKRKRRDMEWGVLGLEDVGL